MSRQRVVAKVALYTENNVRTLHHILVHVSDTNFHRILHLTILNDHFVFPLDMWLSSRSINKYHSLSDNIFYCLLRPLLYFFFLFCCCCICPANLEKSIDYCKFTTNLI